MACGFSKRAKAFFFNKAGFFWDCKRPSYYVLGVALKKARGEFRREEQESGVGRIRTPDHARPGRVSYQARPQPRGVE